MFRIVALTIFFLLMHASCLFVPAATLDWPMAWVYLGLYLGFGVVAFVIVDPDLIRHRAGWRGGFKHWDPPLATVGFLLLCPVALVVAGLDVKRFGWSGAIGPAIQICALVVFVLGYAVGVWAMRVNRFFVKFVRIQHDRGHQVVKDGPYAYVRHPGYAAGILAHVALVVALGSLWALVPACFGAALFVVRTWLEDRTLLAELAGYRDYARDVRWRLVPGVW